MSTRNLIVTIGAAVAIVVIVLVAVLVPRGGHTTHRTSEPQATATIGAPGSAASPSATPTSGATSDTDGDTNGEEAEGCSPGSTIPGCADLESAPPAVTGDQEDRVAGVQAFMNQWATYSTTGGGDADWYRRTSSKTATKLPVTLIARKNSALAGLKVDAAPSPNYPDYAWSDGIDTDGNYRYSDEMTVRAVYVSASGRSSTWVIPITYEVTVNPQTGKIISVEEHSDMLESAN